MNLTQLINEVIEDWFYQHPHGFAVKPYNTQDLKVLREVLESNNYPTQVIEETIEFLTEKDIVKNKKTGNVYPVANHNADTQTLVKKDASDDEIAAAKKGSKKDPASKDDTPEKDTSIDPESANLIKRMEGSYGIDSRIAKTLEKFPNTFGETEKAKVKELEGDFKEFLKSPTPEVAQAIIDTYNLSTNESGSKLYLGFVVGDGRKALGDGSKLPKEMVAAIEKQIPEFKQQGDPVKAAKQAVTTTSKPDISGAPSDDTPITYIDKKGNERTTTAGKAKKAKRNSPAKKAYLKKTSIATADTDDVVKEIFTRDPFDYLDDSMKEVFGPKGEDGKLLSNQGGENAKAYFDQSIENNTALTSTMSKLEELEKAGTANPAVRESLQEHEDTLKKISADYKLPSKEAEEAVNKSYAKMAQKMSAADPEMTNAIFKNVAEMALYDSEIAGGTEAYLPSAGTFPSGDKIRVDREDGSSKVEKIAAVSCKYGKSSSGTYGFPGETQQYIKFHPDPKKRDLMNNRVGAPGYSLGVKDSMISDPEEFNEILKESGIGPAIKEGGAEAIRSAMDDAKNKIAKLVGPEPVPKAKLVSMATELKAINNEVIKTLNENVDKKQLQGLIGGSYDEESGKTSGNMTTFFAGGAHAASMMAFGASLSTSNGLETIEHHHQVIDDDGLHMETTTGSPSMKDWNLTHRMFDGRGGGIIAGSTGPGEKK